MRLILACLLWASLAAANDKFAVNESEFVFLKVDKHSLQAELMTWPQDPERAQVLHKFKIAIGKAKGDKQKKGDNKTPEGIYFTKKILDGKKLPAKYGPNAITLNYPNPVDLFQGKTGYGIWLHGVIKDERIEEANVTEGCVAFYNADIVRLTDWLRPQQGLVMIVDKSNTENRKADIATITDQTMAWADAWRNRQADEYLDFYDQSFRSKGMNLSAYRDYKTRVFKSYKKMTVNIDKLRVLTHPKYAVSIMNQDFFGDNRFSSLGRKILYWRFDENKKKWLITREVFENRKFDFINLRTLKQSFTNPKARLATDKS